MPLLKKFELIELSNQQKDSGEAELEEADAKEEELLPPPILNNRQSLELSKIERSVGPIISNDYSELLKELDLKEKSIIFKSKNMIYKGKQNRETASICKLCGKEGQWNAIRDHIEVKYLEGVFLPCNICGKKFGSRSAMRYHKSERNTCSHYNK